MKYPVQLQIGNFFQYHAPSADQLPRYDAIRARAGSLAELICELTPPGPDQTAAIRKLRECVMTANAAIACGEAKKSDDLPSALPVSAYGDSVP